MSEFVVDKEKLEVRMTRVFEAPVDRVYQACTDPEQIPKWWGPAKYKTVVDKMDFRVGGQWRFIQSDDEGNEFAFKGEYKEIIEGKRVSNTFEFEPMPGHVLLETATYEELPDGRSKLTTVSHFDNLQDLESMVSTGMESGAAESQERLAALVEA